MNCIGAQNNGKNIITFDGSSTVYNSQGLPVQFNLAPYHEELLVVDTDAVDTLPVLKRQEAIILSMTGAERRNPKLLNASRRKRIARGSGTTVQDVNRLIKQFEHAAAMMKQAAKMGGRGLMGGRPPPGFGPPPFGR